MKSVTVSSYSTLTSVPLWTSHDLPTGSPFYELMFEMSRLSHLQNAPFAIDFTVAGTTMDVILDPHIKLLVSAVMFDPNCSIAVS